MKPVKVGVQIGHRLDSGSLWNDGFLVTDAKTIILDNAILVEGPQ